MLIEQGLPHIRISREGGRMGSLGGKLEGLAEFENGSDYAWRSFGSPLLCRYSLTLAGEKIVSHDAPPSPEPRGWAARFVPNILGGLLPYWRWRLFLAASLKRAHPSYPIA